MFVKKNEVIEENCEIENLLIFRENEKAALFCSCEVFRGRQKIMRSFLTRLNNLDRNLKTSVEIRRSESSMVKLIGYSPGCINQMAGAGG